MDGKTTPRQMDLSGVPGVESYLRSLPEGIDSYPDCLVRTDFTRNAQADFPDVFQNSLCPRLLRDVLTTTESTIGWQPIAHAFATLRLLRDIGCGGSQVLWTEKSEAGIRAVLSQPLFRALFFVLSPHLLVLGFRTRFGSFCRGVELVPTAKERQMVEFRFVFPYRLLDGFAMQMFAMALKTAIATTRTQSVTARVTRLAEREAYLLLQWM